MNPRAASQSGKRKWQEPGVLRKMVGDHPLFQALPASSGATLSAAGNIVRFPKYSLLTHQHEEVSAVYLILDGLVKIYRDLGDADRIMDFYYRGDLVGIEALFMPGGHCYAAQALESVTVCALPVDSLLRLADEPAWQSALLKASAERHRAMLEQMDVLTSRSANGCVAAHILRLGKKFGKSGESGEVIQLRITQRELASMSGTNRESVCKALISFKNEKSIDIHNKLIVIKDRAKLEQWP